MKATLLSVCGAGLLVYGLLSFVPAVGAYQNWEGMDYPSEGRHYEVAARMECGIGAMFLLLGGVLYKKKRN